MPLVHLVRHGQASFHAEDYDQLSPLGERQAAHLGAWFAQCRRPVNSLHRGSLKRHRQTAEHFLQALPQALRPALPAAVDEGFDEFDHDAVLLRARPDMPTAAALRAWTAAQAQPARAFQQLFTDAMARWMGGAHDADYAIAWADFRGRCLQALQRALASAGDARHVVVVTSGGPIAALTQHALRLGDAETAQLCWGLANSGVTSLHCSAGGRLALSQLNSFAHLEAAADPTLLSYR